MEDHGPPIAYTALADGVPVYDKTGAHVGEVEHVLADEDADIFDGLIVDTTALPGGHVFADVDQIDELRERAVLLAVERDALHEPSENPAVMEAQPDDTSESDLQRRLRRAWDWVSGRY